MVRWLGLTGLIFLVSAAHAVDSRFELLLDLDNNPSSGCTVATSQGPFDGVDAIVTSFVATVGLDNALVTSVEQRDCTDPGTNTFGPPQVISPGDWPVGIGNGEAGFNVIETFVPLSPGQWFQDIRVGLIASDEFGNSSALLTTTPSGGPIVIRGLPMIPVPLASPIILALLALLLLSIGVAVISRRGRLSLTALAFLGLGSAAAAACVLDGEIFDWSLDDLLATGTATDPNNGVELRALFGKLDSQSSQLCFRIDAALVFSESPQAEADDYVAVETNVLVIPAGSGLLVNDSLGLPAAELVGFGGGDLGGTPADNGPGSTIMIGADGSVTVNADGSFSFQSETGFEGDFEFFYRLENIAGQSDGLVTIEVQSIPVAQDDAYAVVDTDTLSVPAPGVLGNDTGLPAPLVTSFGGGDLGGAPGDNAAGSSVVVAGDGSLTLNADGSLSFDPPSGQTGPFEFDYVIGNPAGNASATVTISVNQAPNISSADALFCAVGNVCSFSFTADGFPDPTITLTGTLPSGVSFNAVSEALEGTPEVGSGAAYVLTITAANGIGTDAEQTFTLTINEAPTITSADILGCEVESDCDFNFTADGFPAPTFDLPGLPGGLSLDPVTGVLSGQPDAGTGGQYNLVLEASNSEGTDTQGFTLDIGQVPVITSVDNLICEVDQPCSLTLSATGFPAPTFDLPGLPSGLTLDSVSGQLSGTPGPGTGGLYNLVAEASNSVGTDDQAFTLTINQAPQITSANSLDCIINQPCSFTATATGYPDPSFDLPGLPTGLGIDPVTGLISGTPSQGGVFNLTLEADNGVAPVDTQAFTLQVGAPPAITSANAASCDVGVACSFTFTASGTPAPTITLTGGLPTGVTFDGGTASLSGTPQPGSGGTYNLTVEAGNGFPPEASQGFVLTVSEAPMAMDDPSGGIPGGSSPGSMPYHGAFNTNLVVSAAEGVLANDDLGFPVAVITTPAPTAANGSVALGLDGSFVYTPNSGFVGLDSFQYCIENMASTACADVSVAIGIRPAAANTAYPAALIGNMAIDTQVSTGLTVAASGDAISLSLVGSSNGNASVRADGTYTFDPAPGHSGPASLIYRVSNGFGDAEAQINFTVGEGIWFVDNAQPAGDGRQGSPFDALAPAAGQANGWPIFIASGSGNYTGGLSLSASRTLIGQPSAASLEAITALTAPADSLLPAVTATRPSIVNPGGPGLTLGSDNRIYSLQIANTSGFGITGTGFGTLTAENLVISGTGGALSLATGTVAGSGFVSVSSSSGANNVTLSGIAGVLNLGTGALSGATGTAFNVSGGTGDISYAGTITAGTAQRPVNIEAKTAGTVVLTGQVSSSHQGVRLNGNTGATVRFAGGMTLQTGAGIAFSATAGGTVEVCDENPCNPVATGGLVNTLQTTTAIALNVADTTIGANRLEFRSIASNGAASGIVLNNTGTAGGLTVRGTGAAGTGGSIQSASVGVQLTAATSTDLRNMNIPGSSNTGIRAINVNGLILNNVAVTNTGTALGHNGIFLTDPAGALDLTNVTATGNFQNNVRIDDSNNSGGTVTLTVTGGTYANNNSVTGDSGMLINVGGTAVWGPSLVTGATFSLNRVVGLFVVAGDSALINEFNVVNNSFQGSGAAVGQQIGLDMSKALTSTMTVQVADNTFLGHNSQAMNFFTAAGPGTGGAYNARIENNVVGNAAVFGSGSRIGNCMRIAMQGDSVDRVLVNGNTLRQCPNGRGIEVFGRNGNGGLDATITNNQSNNDFVTTPENGGFSLASIFVQSNCVGNCNTVRADVRGNTVPNTPPNGDVVLGQIGLVRTSTSTLQMVDTTAPISGTCATELAGTNTGNTAVAGVCTLIAGPINTPP